MQETKRKEMNKTNRDLPSINIDKGIKKSDLVIS